MSPSLTQTQIQQIRAIPLFLFIFTLFSLYAWNWNLSSAEKMSQPMEPGP